MDNIDSGFNLASMDWQDFENLIREIFEKNLVKMVAKSRLLNQAGMVELMQLHLTLTLLEEEK